MEKKIRVGIIGYGNLGKGVELALSSCPDMELCGVFTRRPPESMRLVDPTVKVYSVGAVEEYKDLFDVMILCGGSATDLPVQTPEFASHFNVVDSFDTHARIPEHFEKVDSAAKAAGKTALISCGWDPGLFSLIRLIGSSVLPNGKDYTFWGKGVSQGHSDAIRRIPGVKSAKQYTVPIDSAIDSVRAGQMPELGTGEKHTRECFVVAEEGADKDRIEREIVTMPNYFADYQTTVHFISEEEFKRDHSGMAHGGFVIRSGKTGIDGSTDQLVEFSLKLGSNPEFTASVLVAYARAVVRMNKEGKCGAVTVFDVAPTYLSPISGDELRKKLL